MHLMFTSCYFDSDIPWASLDHDITMVKLALKFLVSFAFVFDKAGNATGPVNLVCFALSAIITYRRFTKALLFKRNIQKIKLVFDVLVTIFFLVTGL